MTARDLLPDERRRMIVELLRSRGGVTVAELEARFGISLVTARRDLAELERVGYVRRTRPTRSKRSSSARWWRARSIQCS